MLLTNWCTTLGTASATVKTLVRAARGVGRSAVPEDRPGLFGGPVVAGGSHRSGHQSAVVVDGDRRPGTVTGGQLEGVTVVRPAECQVSRHRFPGQGDLDADECRDDGRV